MKDWFDDLRWFKATFHFHIYYLSVSKSYTEFITFIILEINDIVKHYREQKLMNKKAEFSDKISFTFYLSATMINKGWW